MHCTAARGHTGSLASHVVSSPRLVKLTYNKQHAFEQQLRQAGHGAGLVCHKAAARQHGEQRISGACPLWLPWDQVQQGVCSRLAPHPRLVEQRGSARQPCLHAWGLLAAVPVLVVHAHAARVWQGAQPLQAAVKDPCLQSQQAPQGSEPGLLTQSCCSWCCIVCQAPVPALCRVSQLYWSASSALCLHSQQTSGSQKPCAVLRAPVAERSAAVGPCLAGGGVSRQEVRHRAGAA